MIFIRNRTPIIHSYHVLGSDVLRADNYVIRLGFKLKNLLDSDPNFEMVCNYVVRIYKLLA